ncbi:MAG: hypothetical protein CL678_17255 [Bdellovibrionaceae bacterium]|nr:hypothetical protein [Pseudobdellovibrionaceae bacterium]|tara:strand:+ start:1416 stop:2609 length:1194 start_codon:yes stop_codon:yes gene_type:complete
MTSSHKSLIILKNFSFITKKKYILSRFKVFFATIQAPMRDQKFYLTIITLLITVSLGALYLYQREHSKRVALQLKIKLLSGSNKKAVSWETLKKDAQPPSETIENQNHERTITKPILTSQEKKKPLKQNFDVHSAPTETLIQLLEKTTKTARTQKLESINKGIEIANEMISRAPDSYSAYKAKLILMLTKEGKYAQSVDDQEVDQVLDEMASFDFVGDKTLHKETFLILRTNSQIDTLENEIEKAEQQLDDLDQKIETNSDPEIQNTLLSDKNLAEQELDKKLDLLSSLENSIEEGLLEQEDFFNDDIIEIPFKRALAKENYDSVIEESEALLDEFPESIRGYYFLVKALELKGEQEEALEVLAESDLPEEKLRLLESRLKESKNKSFKNYWRQLRF